jgi:hypothetical protein
MNLNGMDIVAAGSSKAGGGGLFQKLLGTFASNQQILQDHQLRMARTTHDVNEKVRGQKEMSENGIQGLLSAHDATQEKYTAEHPDVVAGKAKEGEFVRPYLAEHARLAGLTVDSKSQWNTGPVAGITRTNAVNARPALQKTVREPSSGGDARKGRNASFNDTLSAVKSNLITPEDAAEISPKFNTGYTRYKEQNPGYKGSSETHINKVNTNLNNLESK